MHSADLPQLVAQLAQAIAGEPTGTIQHRYQNGRWAQLEVDPSFLLIGSLLTFEQS